MAGAVAVDGREPNRVEVPGDVLPSDVPPGDVVGLEPVEAAPLGAPFAPWPGAVESADGVVPLCEAQVLSNSVVGDVPAEAFAPRHDDADGVPAAPLPSALFAEKSSDAVDGPLPQLVPELASVGTPGETSAVEQVEAFVGSSAEAIPAADPANEPVAVATRFARTRESEVETLLRLVSAFADGPDVVGVGADPSGVDGSGSDVDAVAGTVAVVPGPVAVVEPPDDPSGELVFELETVIGSLEETVAGPASPPVAEADPPAVEEPCGSGLTSGCAEMLGVSASAEFPSRLRSAMTAMRWSSFLIF